MNSVDRKKDDETITNKWHVLYKYILYFIYFCSSCTSIQDIVISAVNNGANQVVIPPGTYT